MQLMGFDENAYQDCVVKEYDQCRAILRKCYIGEGVSIICMLIGFAFVMTSGDNPSDENYWKYMLIVIFSISACIFLSVVIFPIMRIKKRFHVIMVDYEHPDVIELCPDFTIRVIRENGINIHIKEVHSIAIENMTGHFVVHGKIMKGNMDIGVVKFYQYLKDYTLLKNYLSYILELNKMDSFKNTIMKNILQMDGERRNRMFIEELKQTQLLLPIRLLDEQHNTHNIFSIFESLFITYASDENDNLCFYTSKQEVDNEILKQYPKCLIVSLPMMYKLLRGTDSNVFKSHNRCAVINPNSDRIELSGEQLQKIQGYGGC